MHTMFPLFCNFRNGKSYKIRGTQNKGPATVVFNLRILYSIEISIFERVLNTEHA